ncbi:MAG: phosphatase PAP2 family protein [Hyphomicrobiaceae bacterium]
MPQHKPTPASACSDQDMHRLVLAGMVTCVGLVAGAIAFADRPVADFAHASLRVNEGIFAALTHIVDPVPVYAGIVTGGYAIAALLGVRPGPRGVTALRIAIAILVAIALKEQLKFLFGRTWPETWTGNNPSYIKDGVYGFFPLKGLGGGRAYHSFPSGHMTAITVAAVSVALNWPRWRWVACVPVGLVAVGMIGANYHWVSDLIAGTFLGAGVAVAAHTLGRDGG